MLKPMTVEARIVWLLLPGRLPADLTLVVRCNLGGEIQDFDEVPLNRALGQHVADCRHMRRVRTLSLMKHFGLRPKNLIDTSPIFSNQSVPSSHLNFPPKNTIESLLAAVTGENV